VSVVVPSIAVIKTVIILEPTFKFIAPEAEPLVTVLPLTFTVAWLSFTVGVTVTVDAV